jgi:hypothetical protein
MMGLVDSSLASQTYLPLHASVSYAVDAFRARPSSLLERRSFKGSSYTGSPALQGSKHVRGALL